QQVQRKDISQLTDMERLRYKACYTERIEGIPARWNHLSMDVLENELRAEARKVIPIERRITDSDHDTDEEINRTSQRRRQSDYGRAVIVWRFSGGVQVLVISVYELLRLQREDSERKCRRVENNIVIVDSTMKPRRELIIFSDEASDEVEMKWGEKV